jgi:Molybdopterin converting factor, small subunit
MTVRVEFYSILRDLAGCEEREFDIEPGATIADLLAKIFRDLPQLEEWDSRLLLAAGLDYVERTHVIQPGEIVSIMPPVQGG